MFAGEAFGDAEGTRAGWTPSGPAGPTAMRQDRESRSLLRRLGRALWRVFTLPERRCARCGEPILPEDRMIEVEGRGYHEGCADRLLSQTW